MSARTPARPPGPGSIPHWPGRARPTARPLAEPVTLRSPAPLPRPGAAPCSRGGTRSALLPPPGPARAPRRAPPDHGLGVRPLPPPRGPPGPRPATARPLPPGLPLHTPVLRAQQVVGEEARRVGDLAEEHQLRHLPPTPHHEPAPGPASPGPRQINGLAEEDRAPRKPSWPVRGVSAKHMTRRSGDCTRWANGNMAAVSHSTRPGGTARAP